MIDQLKAYLPLIMVGIGFVLAWTVQGYRLDALQAKYDKFVIQTEAIGKESELKAKTKEAEDKRKKEEADAKANRTISALRADNKRLYNARANSGYVPAATTGSVRPDLACFDRAEFELALRQSDQATTGLIEEGAKATSELNIAKEWAQNR